MRLEGSMLDEFGIRRNRTQIASEYSKLFCREFAERVDAEMRSA